MRIENTEKVSQFLDRLYTKLSKPIAKLRNSHILRLLHAKILKHVRSQIKVYDENRVKEIPQLRKKVLVLENDPIQLRLAKLSKALHKSHEGETRPKDFKFKVDHRKPPPPSLGHKGVASKESRGPGANKSLSQNFLAKYKEGSESEAKRPIDHNAKSKVEG